MTDEEQRALRRAIGTLPAEARAVARMRAAGMSYRAIAKALGFRSHTHAIYYMQRHAMPLLRTRVPRLVELMRG